MPIVLLYLSVLSFVQDSKLKLSTPGENMRAQNEENPQEVIVFDNLVEADLRNSNFGSSVSMIKPSEPINNINAKGTIAKRTLDDICERAESFASRITAVVAYRS